MQQSFYASIADNYDYIFPFNPVQVEFIKKSIHKTDSKQILEVGCGTGNLTFGLASHFEQVKGVDLDEEMLERAKQKNRFENVSFQKLNMLKLDEKFASNSVDALVCFGNTMVHLSNLQEVESFVLQSKKVIKPGGVLAIQIINYDRILDQTINHLPTIDNDVIEFIRSYEYLKDEHKIDFQTVLTLKRKNERIENSQLLLPIRQLELEKILMKYFTDIEFFGSFKRDPLGSGSVPLIVTAK